MITRILCATTLALTLSACGSINTAQIIPESKHGLTGVRTAKVPLSRNLETSAHTCKPATNTAGQMNFDRMKADLTTSLYKTATTQKAEVAKLLPPELADDPVVSMALETFLYEVARAEYQNLESLRAMQGKHPSRTAMGIAAIQPPSFGESDKFKALPTLSQSDFETFGKRVARLTNAENLSSTQNLSDGGKKAKDRLVKYYTAYFSGEFVDRFGGQLEKPVLSRTINNQFIAGALTVLIEYVADEIVKMPVLRQGDTYYPGASKKLPTVIEIQIPEPPEGTSDADKKKLRNEAIQKATTELAKNPEICHGVTELEGKAILYVGSQAGYRAALLSGLIGESFGGLEFGLGVLGKISIGDHQTLQVVVKTTLNTIATRASTYGAYTFFEKLTYNKDDELLIDLVEKYLESRKDN